ncbi:hypothetical protein SETIT_J017200v2 [Setaria italica]|uniref:NADH:quinone oxidoreductase/Mrp antiporter membrane subunit domain-containing protein n=1 Tax=Setaria italica TaxID=4555 RepID=A0A368PGR5_SETIT|nr:hypothetical protein SETIT_J017200v2 [Setaria italica]
MAFKLSSELVDAAKGSGVPYAKRKRLIEWQRQIELCAFSLIHEQNLALSGACLRIRKRNLMEIAWNKNENFILDSTRIFMKAFHLLLFNGSFIFPECILIFGLILLLMIDLTSDQKDRPWFYFISSTKFLLFVLTATLGGMFLCGANDLITIFVAPECFSLCSYLLSGYTKRDLRSNEATMKYLLMGGASSSILVHEIVNGLINTQMYNSPGISIALIFITVGLGFKLSPAPFHQWTPDVYEGVWAIGYVIIGIIVGDSNDGYASMITYMLFYISMNLGTFACIVLFGLPLCLLSLGGLPPLAGFFGKLYLFWCGWQAGLYFLVSIGLLTSVLSIYYYLKIIKLLMTGRNQEITPYVRNYRRSPLRSNNSIELSMTVCVIASTIPGISMNPILAIAQIPSFSC